MNIHIEETSTGLFPDTKDICRCMHSCVLCPMQHGFKMHCELRVTSLKHANEGDKEPSRGSVGSCMCVMHLSVCSPISRPKFKPVVMPTNAQITVAVATIRKKSKWVSWKMETRLYMYTLRKKRRSAYSKELIINRAAIRQGYCQRQHIHPGGSRQAACATKTSGSVMERPKEKIVSDAHRLPDECRTQKWWELLALAS